MDLSKLADIVQDIDDTIQGNTSTTEQKIVTLQKLADDFWKEVFPEYETEKFRELTDEEMEVRWAKVRKAKLVDCYANKDNIMYVIDWPSTNGNFHWLT